MPRTLSEGVSGLSTSTSPSSDSVSGPLSLPVRLDCCDAVVSTARGCSEDAGVGFTGSGKSGGLGAMASWIRSDASAADSFPEAGAASTASPEISQSASSICALTLFANSPTSDVVKPTVEMGGSTTKSQLKTWEEQAKHSPLTFNFPLSNVPL